MEQNYDDNVKPRYQTFGVEQARILAQEAPGMAGAIQQILQEVAQWASIGTTVAAVNPLYMNKRIQHILSHPPYNYTIEDMGHIFILSGWGEKDDAI